MSVSQQWRELTGGLKISVVTYDKKNRVHQNVVHELLSDAVKTVAAVHGASFSEAGFRNVMHYLNSGDIKAEFYVAAWDVCHPKFVGGVIYYNAIGIDQAGKPRLARYNEDVCLLGGQLRDLILEMPPRFVLPKALGEKFERLSQENYREDRSRGVVPEFVLGEFDPLNTKMARLLRNTGALLGDPKDSAVFEFMHVPEVMRNKIPMVVSKVDLYVNGEWERNNFIVRWREQTNGIISGFGPQNENGIDVIVTRGFATASGASSLAQIRPVQFGSLPNEGVLDCALSSLMIRAESEIKEVRKWGVLPFPIVQKDEKDFQNSDSISFVGLLEACGNEVMSREVGQSDKFGGPMIPSHIHVLSHPEFLAAFERLDAERRVLGTRSTVPGIKHLSSVNHSNNGLALAG